MSHGSTTLPSVPPEIDGGPGRELVETLIDQMSDQSFPASDPPTWGAVKRLAAARRCGHDE